MGIFWMGGGAHSALPTFLPHAVYIVYTWVKPHAKLKIIVGPQSLGKSQGLKTNFIITFDCTFDYIRQAILISLLLCVMFNA